ncbi:hypothetical protein GGX14DRAFT_646988 [Mycena pura]|uniref:Uncharacterized protein n=1 Tax=Mycena pura TaxID=153505 RepID=A0AAD6V6M1_9AGAR|nr:hypothetical protein GGX14DRAFT_646988 [Mycena pura]
MASPLSSTLLALGSCVANNIVQYTVLSLLALYSTLHVSRPLLPSARIDTLERLITETADLLEKAHEERVFFSRDFNFNIQLRLSQALETKSTLRSRILLQFGLNHSASWNQEYLYVLGDLSRSIQQCARDVKDIKVTILVTAASEQHPQPVLKPSSQAEMEHERRLLYRDDISDRMTILASGSYVSESNLYPKDIAEDILKPLTYRQVHCRRIG